MAAGSAVASGPAAAPANSSSDQPVEPRVLHSPVGTTEVGILNGAPYRIDVPDGWNHSLVVFYHGYAEQPVTFHLAERVISQQQPFLDRHYAILQSAYSQTGWALQQAYPETESLRRYFSKKYGAPHETYVAGLSMGGELVSITLELNPKPYVGGLEDVYKRQSPASLPALHRCRLHCRGRWDAEHRGQPACDCSAAPACC